MRKANEFPGLYMWLVAVILKPHSLGEILKRYLIDQ